jgi:hypothetical protein
MANLPNDGREYIHWPITNAPVGAEFEAYVLRSRPDGVAADQVPGREHYPGGRRPRRRDGQPHLTPAPQRSPRLILTDGSGAFFALPTGVRPR